MADIRIQKHRHGPGSLHFSICHLQQELHSQVGSMMVMAGAGSLWTRGKRGKYSPRAWNINSSLHSDCFNLCHTHDNCHQGDARHSLTPLIIQGGRNVGTSTVTSTTPASQEHPPQIEFFPPPQLRTQPQPFPQHDGSYNMFPNSLVALLWI